MGSFSIGHWVVVLAVVMILFGRGKVSELMGDVAKGLKSFKKGMAEEDDARPGPPRPLASLPAPPRDTPETGTPERTGA
ncbi:twin-arginine translocase TatA/TatE family subunit [Acuticoccus sediminis]|uniref:Sec-independent protein translocase protein TatA n=1 Tax=Acuticoccus sediminis TaxID=2184697 RepID=A0A8B2NVL5_9HYPH|nr:twin-arginine translocase TatA/TatE family subunit [Acuticoccus sediminis]